MRDRHLYRSTKAERAPHLFCGAPDAAQDRAAHVGQSAQCWPRNAKVWRGRHVVMQVACREEWVEDAAQQIPSLVVLLADHLGKPPRLRKHLAAARPRLRGWNAPLVPANGLNILRPAQINRRGEI